jgi:hypothetical protein
MNTPLEENYRIRQINNDTVHSLGSLSFTVRPISLLDSSSNALSIKALPFLAIQQFNSKRPYQYADGAMFPTRGWNFFYSAGFQARYKGLTLIARPEFTWGLNQDFTAFPDDHFPIVWKYYYEWQNRIDMPEKFPDKPLQRGYFGQSRFQYAYKGFALGVSTENLWWGPGRYNSLLMSNAAPGFFHYTFHSDAPLLTPVGSFEWQLISGRLNPSGAEPINTLSSYDRVFLYVPKDPVGKRTINGGVLTWQPKWVRGLFIGIDAASYHYSGQGRKNAQMGSLFFRYAIPDEHTEVYFQYGRHDKFASPINIFQDTIPRGYLGGFRKLIPLSKRLNNDQYIQVGLEVTQLQAPIRSQVLRSDSWYTDQVVRHGYTHEGQVLGAPIGPGSNSQRIDVAYIKNDLRIGIELERWLHNTDFYYNLNVNAGSFDYNRQWVDLMASLVWNIPIKNVMLFGQFSAIRAINYQWKAYIPEEGPVSNYFDNGWDFINYHVRSGVQVKL